MGNKVQKSGITFFEQVPLEVVKLIGENMPVSSQPSDGPRPQSSEFGPWQSKVLAALMELDPKVLTIRLAEAEEAVVGRLRELTQDSSRTPEKTALQDAMTSLGVLKRDAKNG